MIAKFPTAQQHSHGKAAMAGDSWEHNTCAHHVEVGEQAAVARVARQRRLQVQRRELVLQVQVVPEHLRGNEIMDTSLQTQIVRSPGPALPESAVTQQSR